MRVAEKVARLVCEDVKGQNSSDVRLMLGKCEVPMWTLYRGLAERIIQEVDSHVEKCGYAIEPAEDVLNEEMKEVIKAINERGQ